MTYAIFVVNKVQKKDSIRGPFWVEAITYQPAILFYDIPLA